MTDRGRRFFPLPPLFPTEGGVNIDRDLVNRALAKAGQERLTEEDIENDAVLWRLAKEFYLPTILETLANTEWTSQIKRVRLEKPEEETEEAENFTEYSHKYFLPDDCAKPIEIFGQDEYSVEARFLYTDRDEAVLVYVTDGKRSPYVLADPAPTEETFPEGEFYTLDGETGEYTLAEEFIPETEYWMISPDDYPEYREFKPDALLSEYLETRLAAKMVLKITGNSTLYQLLFSEANIMEARAVQASMAHSHSKETGHEWWMDTIGRGGDPW